MWGAAGDGAAAATGVALPLQPGTAAGSPGRGAAAPSAPPAPSGQGWEERAGKGVPGWGSVNALPIAPQDPRIPASVPLFNRAPPSPPRRSELRAGPGPVERSGVGGEEGRRRGRRRSGGAAKGERAEGRG